MSRYSHLAYEQLLPAGKERGPSQSVLDPSENGDHYQPEPSFFEWWYFDVALGDGSYLVAILHSSLYNAIDHKPTLDLRYYPRAGAPITAIGRYERTSYRAESDRCCVRIGYSQAVHEGNCYRLELHQEPIHAELTFRPTLPGWKAGTGHLFADPTTNRFFDWVVPLPRAYVEGTLAVDGRQETISGEGYHDHNWGNLYLPTAFRGWTWGRVLADNWTLIFGDVVGRGPSPPHVTPLMLACGEEIVLTTNRITLTHQDPVREPRTGRDFSRQLNVATSVGPEIKLMMEARRAMDALDFASLRPLFGWHPCARRLGEYAFYLAQNHPPATRIASWLLGKGSYMRWLADYDLELPEYNVSQAGRGMYEVMFL